MQTHATAEQVKIYKHPSSQHPTSSDGDTNEAVHPESGQSFDEPKNKKPAVDLTQDKSRSMTSKASSGKQIDWR